jgi:hypothetical protein
VWETNINKEDSMANAAAAMLIWALHSFNGTDKLGMPYLQHMRHIATNLGLYDHRIASQVYDSSYPRRTRARAVLAWGMHHWAV